MRADVAGGVRREVSRQVADPLWEMFDKIEITATLRMGHLLTKFAATVEGQEMAERGASRVGLMGACCIGGKSHRIAPVG